MNTEQGNILYLHNRNGLSDWTYNMTVHHYGKKTDFLPLQNITVFKAKKLRNFPQTEFFKALQITGNICLLTEVCDLVSAHTKLQCLAKVD